MHKLRLAIVTAYPPSQGSLNEYAYHFLRHLKDKDEVDRVYLLVDELPEGLQYTPEDKIEIIPCWRFGAINNPVRIWREIRKIKPDAVLFNIQFATFGSGKVSAALGLTIPAIVKFSGFPTIVLLHNIMETVDLKQAGFHTSPLMEKLIRLFGNIVTRLLLRADLVALTIPKYVYTLKEKYSAHNVMLVPHGSFETLPEPNFDLPPGPQQIMTFGKFGTYKRVEILIEAYRLLQNNGHNAIELVIAGRDSPNSPGYLEGIQRQYKDVPNIRYTGYVREEEVPTIFQNAAVVVFPYTSTTGSSGVLHQAGGYGKAVVLPHLGDFAELIKDEGYTGEFFEPDDPQSLADAIAKILDNPERRIEVGHTNFIAAQGLPIGDLVDWYLLHIETLL